jgi:hypothetical protein
MTRDDILNGLNVGDRISFFNTMSWIGGVYTLRRVTEKAVLVNGEWIPKSQITNAYFVDRKTQVRVREDWEDGLTFDDQEVSMVEVVISDWFDEVNYNKRKSSHGY